MIKNCVRCRDGTKHNLAFDEQGGVFELHEPFPCACGELSCYGKDDVWYCLKCWLGAQK